MCEGLSKISSNFTLHLIKVGKLKQFKKVPSDLKTILKTHLAILGFLSFKKGRGRTVAFFFYVASYVVPQICHDIYATGVLEVARVGHK